MPLDIQTRAEIGRTIDKHGFSISRAVLGQIERRPGVDAGMEMEVCAAYKKAAEDDGRMVRGTIIPFALLRTLTRDLTTTATSGGELIGTDHLADQFVELLRPVNVSIGLGATVVHPKGNVSIPKVSAGATAEWVAENAAPSETTHTTASISMSPKHIAGYTEIGRTLAIQSAPSIDAVVAGDLRAALSTGLDVGAINGTGTDEQPTGILSTSGIGAVAGATNGLAITWGNCVDVVKEVAIDNAEAGRLGFATNSKVIASMRKTPRQSSGVEGAFILAEGKKNLLGYTVGETQNVPSNLTKGSGSNLSALIFGNWADLVISIWGEGPDVVVNPFADSTKGLIRISVFLDCDIAVKRAQSFAAIQDIIAS